MDVERILPASLISSDEIGAPIKIKEEVEMKRIVFLIIASLLVLGLVLPGCTPSEEVIYTFEDGEVIIGICADIGHPTGDANKYGIILAANEINTAGGINISGVAHNLTYVLIDTDEFTDETGGVTGAAALQAQIDNVDFVMGGSQSGAVAVYREVAMDAHKVFCGCGAAGEALCNSVVTNYDKYKYFFRGTPYNEYFLAQSALRLVNSVALEERAALNLSSTDTLRAVIISENLTGVKNQLVPAIAAGLPALNIALNQTYYVNPGTSGDTIAALADIYAKGYNPHIIIPVYTGTMGVVYDGYLAAYAAADVLCPMSVGINVMEELKTPWAGVGTNLTSPPPGGPYCAYNCHLDTWAEGVNYTAKTYAFFMGFLTLTGGGNPALGEYPLYTAATYDTCFILKTFLEDVAYWDAGDGVAKVNAADVIAWYEDPTSAPLTTTGTSYLYPPWDGTTTYYGDPALNKVQKEAIYGSSWAYHTYEWLMPPHTSHDLVYGPGYATGIGAQWQWDAEAGRWKKVGVWPMDFGDEYDEALTDQYGCWNFAYNGTVPLMVPQNIIDHHKP